MQERSAKLLSRFGRWSFWVGALIVAFLGFQLFGTGVMAESAQQQLAVDFEQLSETVEPVTDTETSSEDDSPTAQGVAPPLSPDQLPSVGEPLGVIRIPTIGVDQVIVSGVGLDELRDGPGHFTGSPLPGQKGNAALAGHRTTYGAPFADLDLLGPGDFIEVTTLQGTFEYEVLPQTSASGRAIGHLIVAPSDTYVVEDYGDNRLTLTACHPKYTARERIIVHAALVSTEARFGTAESDDVEPTQEATTETDPVEQGFPVQVIRPTPDLGSTALQAPFGWHTDEIPGVLLWALACAIVLGLLRWLSPRLGRWPTLLLTVPTFLGCLWACFSHLDRLLPPI